MTEAQDPLHIPQNDRDDESTAKIIQRVVAPGTIAVDVGANVGDVTNEMVKAAPDAPRTTTVRPRSPEIGPPLIQGTQSDLQDLPFGG